MDRYQCRAARALLDWNQEVLAKKAAISVTTLRNYERGASVPVPNNLSALVAALQAAGIEFLNDDEGAGVWLKRKPGRGKARGRANA
jgi:transcriptional regulator with XRE-family HTH domain